MLFPTYAVFLFNDCFLYWSCLKYSTYLCYWISNIRRVNTNEVNDCWSGYGALLHSLSSGVAIYYDLSQDLAFWYAGGVAGIKWEHLKFLVPIILITIIFATMLGRSISLISMGDDVATNLGVKTNRTRILGMIIVVILAGVSVSAVGSIGFVGLVIPHIARKLVGVNYRLIIPMSALLGAMLLVVADLGARAVNPPKELAIGIMVALVGVPFFLYIARKVGREL